MFMLCYVMLYYVISCSYDTLNDVLSGHVTLCHMILYESFDIAFDVVSCYTLLDDVT
jgi:hypothetical protein